MRLLLCCSFVFAALGCGSPTVLLDTKDSGADAGGEQPSLFGLFHLEGQLDGGQLVASATSAENYEFRADGQFRYSQRDCASAGNATGTWERLGNALAVPSDDKPGKPRFVFEPADAGSLVRHLEGNATFSLWSVGGRCGACDAGVFTTHSCSDPF